MKLYITINHTDRTDCSETGSPGLSYGTVIQDCHTGLSYGTVIQDCHTGLSYRTVIQDCHTGLSYGTVTQLLSSKHFRPT